MNIYIYNTGQFQDYMLKNKLYINTLAVYTRENSGVIELKLRVCP